MKLSDIAPIVQGACAFVQSINDLDSLVEPPLLPACQALYQKGIRTVGSSANCKDVRVGSVWIIVDATALSEDNLAIAHQAGRVVTRHYYAANGALIMSLGVNSQTTAEEVEVWSLARAAMFKEQAAKWVTHHTLDQLRSVHCSPNLSISDAIEREYAFDEASGLFFHSEEQRTMWNRPTA